MLILYVCVGQILWNVTFLSFFPNNSFNRQLSFKVDVMNHMECLGHKDWKKLPQHLSPICLRSCAFFKCLQLVCCTEQIKLWEAIGWIKQYFCWTCWTPFVPSILFSLPVRCVGLRLLKMFWRWWWIGFGAQRRASLDQMIAEGKVETPRQIMKIMQGQGLI